MIDFQLLKISQKEAYQTVLLSVPNRGCEYSFANLCLWGHQQVAFLHGCAAFFSHFFGRSVYPYPIGNGDRRAVLEEIIADSRQRGIPCRITSVLPQDREELEQWFPGQFLIRTDRDSFDYVYGINDLADLKGRKFQKKRNHFNRFRAEHPNYTTQPLTLDNVPLAQEMVEQWYARRLEEDPHGNYLLERIAPDEALRREILVTNPAHLPPSYIDMPRFSLSASFLLASSKSSSASAENSPSGSRISERGVDSLMRRSVSAVSSAER